MCSCRTLHTLRRPGSVHGARGPGCSEARRHTGSGFAVSFGRLRSEGTFRRVGTLPGEDRSGPVLHLHGCLRCLFGLPRANRVRGGTWDAGCVAPAGVADPGNRGQTTHLELSTSCGNGGSVATSGLATGTISEGAYRSRVLPFCSSSSSMPLKSPATEKVWCRGFVGLEASVLNRSISLGMARRTIEVCTLADRRSTAGARQGRRRCGFIRAVISAASRLARSGTPISLIGYQN